MHPNLISLMLFCFVTSCTPGPNNILASYSSFNFGIKKTLPHMLGVALGYTSMITILDIGLIFPFKKYPIIQDVLKVLGSIFLIYLAYKISFSKSSSGNLLNNPVKFLESFFFQFIGKLKYKCLSCIKIKNGYHDCVSSYEIFQSIIYSRL